MARACHCGSEAVGKQCELLPVSYLFLAVAVLPIIRVPAAGQPPDAAAHRRGTGLGWGIGRARAAAGVLGWRRAGGGGEGLWSTGR